MNESDDVDLHDIRDVLNLAGIDWRTDEGLRAYTKIADNNIVAASHLLKIFNLANRDLPLNEDALELAIDEMLLTAVKTIFFPDPIPANASTFDELGEVWDGYIESVKQLSKIRMLSTKHDWSRRASQLAAWNIEFSLVSDSARVGPIYADSAHRAAIRLAPELWSGYHIYVNEAETSPEKRPELWDEFIRKWDPEAISTQCEVLRAKLPFERKALRTRLNLFDEDDRPKQNIEGDLATTNKAAIDCVKTVARIRRIIRDAMSSYGRETYPGAGDFCFDPTPLWDPIPEIRTQWEKLIAQHEYLELCLHSTADIIHQACASPSKVAEISLNETWKTSEQSFHEIVVSVVWCVQQWLKDQLLDRENEFYCDHGEATLRVVYANLLKQWGAFDDALINSKLRLELSGAKRIAQKEQAKEDIERNDHGEPRETSILARTVLVLDDNGNAVGRFDPSSVDLLIEFTGDKERDLAGNTVETLDKLYRLPSQELACVSISKVTGEWLQGRMVSESKAREWLSNSGYEPDAILAPNLALQSASISNAKTATKSKGERGRKKISKEKRAKYVEWCHRWASAKAERISKSDLCDDLEIDPSDLENALDWKRKQKQSRKK